MRFHSRYAALIGLIGLVSIGLVSVRAGAVVTGAVGADLPTCDPLAVPTQVDEIGNGPPPLPAPNGAFPVGEQLVSGIITTNGIACPDTKDPLLGSFTIRITNVNAVAFSDVWYVADPETTVTNVDGTINGMLAFKIDKVGANAPLIGETGALDSIWSPGETWFFILQDYTNLLGLPPHFLGSIGVPSPGDGSSSGSIIAIPVPEPASAALVALGLLAIAEMRRRTG